MTHTPTLIHLLERFNRKERYFLLAHALGNARFQLSYEFRLQLGKKLGVDVPIDASCWMDYPLDWLYAALELFSDGHHNNYPSPNFPGKTDEDPPFNVNVNQEDIDLLIAFESDSGTQLILIEAKGVGAFGNTQLRSKARRLRVIFGDEGERHASRGIRPHFLIASPEEPRMYSETYSKGLTTARFRRG